MLHNPPFHIDGSSGGNIYGNWNAANYEAAVRCVLTRIRSTTSGRALANSIRHRIEIVPYDFRNRPNQCDAGANIRPPRTVFNVSRAMATDVFAPATPTCAAIAGQGTGSGSQLQYTPGFFVPGSRLHCIDPGPGMAVDEALYHEIVHAAMNSAGAATPHPLRGFLQHFQSFDEYTAVIVTNVFSSETGRDLRGSYPGTTPLHDPAGFYARNDNAFMIGRVCRLMPVLTRELARVPCNFNPFREFYRASAGLTPHSTRANTRGTSLPF
ncbi:MAG: hypothetical protein OEU09_04040 [Rhodospirillales bacterium]|nr:hypothetical protein [Rhodospirillales bacterium]MDH3790765.1 hypothetical protein [Rhodospirillales bacterium]MDH3910443.1 hypothetical protein [Rhodospirillales bacterium]MDH3919144.1 hypothetical protein [Rhodospirillales bacterium]MDH3970349.1 hypothetical protein [Rhodospirillales bacterium]